MTRSAFSSKYQEFRKRLVRARKSAGLTQVEVAKRLKKPQSFVSKVERGERRLDVVEFIEFAKAVGVDASALLKEIS